MYVFCRAAEYYGRKEVCPVNMTQKEYGEYVKGMNPPSPMGKNILKAFLVGGAICCVGQAIGDGYQALGLTQEDASTAVSMTLVFLSTFFTALGLYHKLARHAGAGTLVPLRALPTPWHPLPSTFGQRAW